jgi:hypothetical protein
MTSDFKRDVLQFLRESFRPHVCMIWLLWLESPKTNRILMKPQHSIYPKILCCGQMSAKVQKETLTSTITEIGQLGTLHHWVVHVYLWP